MDFTSAMYVLHTVVLPYHVTLGLQGCNPPKQLRITEREKGAPKNDVIQGGIFEIRNKSRLTACY
jgi:hypothetical protein